MIQHVSLEVRPDDVPAAVDFWRVLGFEPVRPPATVAETSAWVARDGQQIHLMFRDDAVAPPNGHVALHVPDFADACERLRAAGYEPEARPKHWGAERAFVRGPGGHRVELMAAPPP